MLQVCVVSVCRGDENWLFDMVLVGANTLGFTFVRISSLIVSCNRLWIGTGNGVILRAPLSESE